jgi:RNA polymerase sigma-70 factor (ECF subfamily)
MAIEPWVLDLAEPATTGPDLDTASDERLVREMIAGSEDALASLYDRYASAVFAAAVRTGRDRWIAAEVVQETFLALWNRAELFDPSRGALIGWLLVIARNRTIDRLRAAGRHDRAAAFSSFAPTEPDGHSTAEWLAASGELIGTARPEPVPEVALSSKEDRASIQAAVLSLDPPERAVIVLAYDSGLSQSEIAVRLGLPIGTVKTRTRRALRRLRDRLEASQASGVGPIDRGARASAVDPGQPAQAASPCSC